MTAMTSVVVIDTLLTAIVFMIIVVSIFLDAHGLCAFGVLLSVLENCMVVYFAVCNPPCLRRMWVW